MRSLISIAFALFASAFFPSAAAAVNISHVFPERFVAGDYHSGTLPLDLTLAPKLPDDVTGYTINKKVHTYARSEGNFEEIHSSGWTPTSLTVWVPTKLLKNRGFLQIKVTVDGEDSPLYSMEISPMPGQPPAITEISPKNFPISQKKLSFSVRGTNMDGLDFIGVLVDGKPAFVGAYDLFAGNTSGWATAWMTEDNLNHPGIHKIQLVNRAGASAPVTVMVGKLTMPNVQIAPKTITEKTQPHSGMKVDMNQPLSRTIPKPPTVLNK